MLARWQDEDDCDALDELLRFEIDALARKLRARGAGQISASMSATDLAQEAVLRMLRLEEAPQFTSPDQMRAYLWTAAWRLLVNRMQSPNRQVVRLSTSETRSLSNVFGTSGGLRGLEADDQRAALELVVNLLRPEDRDVLTMVYFQGQSIEESAKKAGLTRAAMDMRLSRARRRLAEKLVDWSDVVG